MLVKVELTWWSWLVLVEMTVERGSQDRVSPPWWSRRVVVNTCLDVALSDSREGQRVDVRRRRWLSQRVGGARWASRGSVIGDEEASRDVSKSHHGHLDRMKLT